MNNGQIGEQKDSREQPLFTEGRGDEDPRSDSRYESRDNISTSNTGANWNAIGNAAMGSPEEVKGEAPSVEYGRVIELKKTPNDSEQGTNTYSKATQQGNNTGSILDLESFRAEKDKISAKTLEKIERTVDDYKNNKISPAEFYDARRRASKAYVKNSFGRENEGDMAA